MPVFVHLTQEKEKNRIQKSGIRKSKIHTKNTDTGVFCMPVINDYFATHQWLREIKRFEKKNIAGVYFRVGSSEPVWYGYYFEAHKKGTAAEAVEAFMRMNDKMGFQVIIPRNIHTEEIIKIKDLYQGVGWRFYPKAHGKRMCLCPGCLAKGDINTNKHILQRFNELITELRSAQNSLERSTVLWNLRDFISDNKRRIRNWNEILFVAEDKGDEVRRALARVLSAVGNNDAFNAVIKILRETNDTETMAVCAEAIINIKKQKGFDYLKEYENIENVKSILDEYKEIFNCDTVDEV